MARYSARELSDATSSGVEHLNTGVLGFRLGDDRRTLIPVRFARDLEVRTVARTTVGKSEVVTGFSGLFMMHDPEGAPLPFYTAVSSLPAINSLDELNSGPWYLSTWDEADEFHQHIVRRLEALPTSAVAKAVAVIPSSMAPSHPARESSASMAPFVSIGIGVAIGASGLPGWGWLIFVSAFVVALGHMAFESGHYRAYKTHLGLTASPMAYLLMSAVTQTALIGIVAFITLVLRGL